MRCLMLSGWAQDPQTLRVLLPKAIEAHALDYMALDEAALWHIAREGMPAPDLLLGWSLGGQLAVRLVVEGILRPRLLVLLGTPCHFQGDAGYRRAVRQFTQTPEVFLRGFAALCDAGGKAATPYPLYRPALQHVPALDDWLRVLEQTDISGLDFSAFPPTLLLHGREDAVIPVAESERLATLIPGSRLHCLPGCGHALHHHATAHVCQLIEEAIRTYATA
ncbi:MAG: alpha/beta fold hydrolase [Hyphomicrobiales bacterium]|nr:alpha/beta fold hydrolase [Hyphomicrobiales bacterium]